MKTGKFSELTNDTLREYHQKSAEVVARDMDIDSANLADEAQTAGTKLFDSGGYHGVNDYPDWKKFVTDLENEMAARGMAFSPISFGGAG
ncbi:MAG: hypothetical protein AAF401_15630 [Pseudomonadota bacterium]